MGVKIKFGEAFALGFGRMIQDLAAQHDLVKEDEDRMMLALLYEVKLRMDQRLLKNDHKRMKMTLTPAQGIAMRYLYTRYINSVDTYMGNMMHMISNEVNQKLQ